MTWGFIKPKLVRSAKNSQQIELDSKPQGDASRKDIISKAVLSEWKSVTAALKSYHPKKEVKDLLCASFGEDHVLSHLFRQAWPLRFLIRVIIGCGVTQS
ncbi:hypothetical protein TNCV_3787231 [Trichonephila clavipes]|nr:hypothetical protein TNCV_3787231 [Trichonephila clavipes]